MSELDKIIIIDDNDGNILFWEMLLPEFNLKIYKSRAGAEALEIIEKEQIPLAVISWELASMPGSVLVQKARLSRKRKRMPFLIYTKKMSVEDVALAKDLGLENITNVPLDKIKVKDTLSKIIESESNITPLEKKLRKMEEYLAESKPTEVLKMVGPDVSKKGPHLPRYKTIIGETFLKIGNLEKAMRVVNECLEIDDKYLPCLYLKSRIFTIQGNHDSAIEVMKTISEKSPKNIQSLMNLGSAYISANKVEEAKGVVNKIKDLDDDNVAINETKGKIAILEGNLPLAAQLLSETQNGDEIARFYNTLGISLVAKGDFDQGIATYQSAVKLLSDKAKLHLLYFNLALAYRKKGETAEEVHYLCESYSVEPAFEKAYASLARGVQEARSKNIELDKEKLIETAKQRQNFLEKNPQVAQALKERLEKSASSKSEQI